MKDTEAALIYWQRVLQNWPARSEYSQAKLNQWINDVRAGRVDYYRNTGSLAMIVIAENCRFGRIGYDHEKEQAAKTLLQQWIEELGIPGQW